MNPERQLHRPSPIRRPARREDGMSLLEVLIAAALILVIAVGLLPLLARSMVNNAKGWRATETTSYSRSSLEDFLEKDLMHADLAVGAAATETTLTERLTQGSDLVGDVDERWWPDSQDLTGKGDVQWTRTRTIRQYNVNDLATPMAGSTPATYVHLKESQVTLEADEEATLLTEGRTLEVRVLKAF